MSQMANILLIAKSTGGIAEYIRWLVKGLDRKRFSLTVVCLSENDNGFASELSLIPGVQSVNYFMDRYKVDLISDLSLGWYLVKILRSGNFNLVHVHGSKAGFLVRVAALGTRLPILYSPHCFAFHDGATRHIIMITSALERFMANFTTKFVAVADGERQLAKRYCVGRDDQFFVIHTGIDPRLYREPTNTKQLKDVLGISLSSPVIGSIGRLCEQKSPLDFVRSAAIIHGLRPDAHFVWVGSGPLEKEMLNLISEFQLESFFHLLGQRSDVPQLLQIFDCFLLTSRWEGLPLVLLEAMSAEVPIVATDILGTRELITHEQNGLLAPVGNFVSMAGAVLELLNNPAKAMTFCSASKRRIDKEFTMERMITALQDLYWESAL